SQARRRLPTWTCVRDLAVANVDAEVGGRCNAADTGGHRPNPGTTPAGALMSRVSRSGKNKRSTSEARRPDQGDTDVNPPAWSFPDVRCSAGRGRSDRYA